MEDGNDETAAADGSAPLELMTGGESEVVACHGLRVDFSYNGRLGTLEHVGHHANTLRRVPHVYLWCPRSTSSRAKLSQAKPASPTGYRHGGQSPPANLLGF